MNAFPHQLAPVAELEPASQVRAYRGYELADWLLRDALPCVLDSIDRPDEAWVLRELPELTADQVGSRKRYPGVLPILRPLDDLVRWDAIRANNVAIRSGWDHQNERLSHSRQDDIRKVGVAARSSFYPSRVGWYSYRLLFTGIRLLECIYWATRDPEWKALYDNTFELMAEGLFERGREVPPAHQGDETK